MPLIPTQEPPYYEITNTPGGNGVKKYVALMSQTGTDAPTAIILENTIGNIIWTYDSVGIYIGTLAGAFPINKVWISQGNTISGQYAYAADANIPPDSIYLNIYEFEAPDWQPQDGKLVKTPLEIRVYP